MVFSGITSTDDNINNSFYILNFSYIVDENSFNFIELGDYVSVDFSLYSNLFFNINYATTTNESTNKLILEEYESLITGTIPSDKYYEKTVIETDKKGKILMGYFCLLIPVMISKKKNETIIGNLIKYLGDPGGSLDRDNQQLETIYVYGEDTDKIFVRRNVLNIPHSNLYSAMLIHSQKNKYSYIFPIGTELFPKKATITGKKIEENRLLFSIPIDLPSWFGEGFGKAVIETINSLSRFVSFSPVETIDLVKKNNQVPNAKIKDDTYLYLCSKNKESACISVIQEIWIQDNIYYIKEVKKFNDEFIFNKGDVISITSSGSDSNNGSYEVTDVNFVYQSGNYFRYFDYSIRGTINTDIFKGKYLEHATAAGIRVYFLPEVIVRDRRIIGFAFRYNEQPREDKKISVKNITATHDDTVDETELHFEPYNYTVKDELVDFAKYQLNLDRGDIVTMNLQETTIDGLGDLTNIKCYGKPYGISSFNMRQKELDKEGDTNIFGFDYRENTNIPGPLVSHYTSIGGFNFKVSNQQPAEYNFLTSTQDNNIENLNSSSHSSTSKSFGEKQNGGFGINESVKDYAEYSYIKNKIIQISTQDRAYFKNNQGNASLFNANSLNWDAIPISDYATANFSLYRDNIPYYDGDIVEYNGFLWKTELGLERFMIIDKPPGLEYWKKQPITLPRFESNTNQKYMISNGVPDDTIIDAGEFIVRESSGIFSFYISDIFGDEIVYMNKLVLNINFKYKLDQISSCVVFIKVFGIYSFADFVA